MNDFFTQAKNRSKAKGIAHRLILSMVLFSSLITLVATAVQLYRDYSRDLRLIDSQLSQIHDVHLPSIAGNLWLLNENGIQILVDGILQLPDILYLEVSDGEKIWATGGVNQSENVIVRRFPLTYLHLGQEQEIGVMTAVATLERVYQRLIDKAADILVSNAIKTFLVAGFMLLLFHFLVTRHLIDIASFVRGQDLGKEVVPLHLDRKSSELRNPDELDLVVNNLNLMRDNLEKSYAKLKESESKYRELYDTMAQGVIYRDENGEVISANNAAQEILGLSLEQMQGKKLVNDQWKAVHENGDEFPGTYFPSMEAMRTGKGIDNIVMGVFHPIDQNYRWIIVSSKPQFSAGESQPHQAFSTFTDITERKRADEERELLIKELEIKNTELERFVYTISHELKTPLVTIAGFAGILLDDVETGSSKNLTKHIQHITSAVETMSILLDELLELSRIGRLDYSVETVAFGELAHEVVKSISSRIVDRDFVIEFAPNLPVVHGDRVRLREVLQSLVDNAIKFCNGQTKPHVKIGMRKQVSETILYVQDNGLGINPAYHNRIFGLFERLDPKIEGTGIGLARVRRILEEHGGRVWVESEGDGMGSTFCFTIPHNKDR